MCRLAKLVGESPKGSNPLLSAIIPCRLMVGHQFLELTIVVRVHAREPCYNPIMELVPKTEAVKVVYIDEYPHLEEKLRLQRLARPAVKQALHDMRNILVFERPEEFDGGA